MQIFLAHSFSGHGEVLLSPEESKHCVKVLRHKVGHVIDIIDGIGNFYIAEITVADPDQCVARIVSQRAVGVKKPYYLHIAISPTKNADRIEWLIEKGTELGVDEFSFVICKRTEKTGTKIERFKKIAESAVKQSIQGVIPTINDGISFKDLIEKEKGRKGSKYIAHCLPIKKTELKSIFGLKDVLILIGPEGDFTEEEIAIAQMSGFAALSLGETRLRTETAGLIVAAGFRANS